MSATSNPLAILFFFLFIAITLGVTYWAARRTKTTEHFYAAGHGVTGFQNGLALAGDYMSAASFLGIAGLVALNGFDGLIYSTGWLVGWPIILFLIAEPLRNLGKYTFSDVVAYRLRQRPVRIAAVIGTMAVVLTYLIAQMVGAGTLIKLLFNLDYTLAIVIVGVVMMTYVLFGGMLATTWVQIIKACLLLGGAVVMAVLVLAKFGFNPTNLFAKAAELNGKQVLEPGTKVVTGAWDAVSLGLALMFGTAGLPHILMRFYTVPDAKQARISVVWATIWIGGFYLITFMLGFGAMVLVGMKEILGVGRRRQHGGPAARQCGRRRGVLRLHLRRRLCHHPGGRRRIDLVRRGRAFARHLGQRGQTRPCLGTRAAAGRADCGRHPRASARSCWESSSRDRTSPTWLASRSRSPRRRTFPRW